MRKLLTFIATFAVLFVYSAGVTYADNISESSASLLNQADFDSFDFRVSNLRKFLKLYNSPLTEYADEFVYYADINGVDYRLVPAITGVESTFGKRIPKDSYNAYGWANGEYKFSSWEDSISHVTEVLKNKYIDKGATTINKIARIYAPPSSTWAGKVTFFVRKIDSLPVNFDII